MIRQQQIVSPDQIEHPGRCDCKGDEGARRHGGCRWGYFGLRVSVKTRDQPVKPARGKIAEQTFQAAEMMQGRRRRNTGLGCAGPDGHSPDAAAFQPSFGGVQNGDPQVAVVIGSVAVVGVSLCRRSVAI